MKKPSRRKGKKPRPETAETKPPRVSGIDGTIDMKRRKWDAAEVEELTRLYKAGMPQEQIAAELTRLFKRKRTTASVSSKINTLIREEVLSPVAATAHGRTKNYKRAVTDRDLYAVLKSARQPQDIYEIMEQLGLEFKEFEKLVHQLRDAGYNVSWKGNNVELVRIIEGQNFLSIPSKSLYNGKWYTFGIVSDVHMGSKYCREDVLKVAYEVFAREGVKSVYVAGNLIDGYQKKVNQHELLAGLQGYTAQVDYLVQRYPQQKGITTYYITGDCHEGWWVKESGIDIGGYIQLKAEKAGRTDLQYIGHIEADIELRNTQGSSIMRIVHPGGGSAYATSYSTQKIVESYQGGEKPAILVVGHYHKHLLQYERNVWVIQAGCVQDQTVFMRKKKLGAHVGCWIIEFHQAKTGEINRLRGEFMPFFDKGFYVNKERYKSW